MIHHQPSRAGIQPKAGGPMLPLHHFENAPKVGPSKEGKAVKLDHPGNFTEPLKITMFNGSIAGWCFQAFFIFHICP
jgi:hypothetical protein